jgi:hypothetical protein
MLNLSHSVKDVALSQFPRCVNSSFPEWKFNDCDDVNRTNFTHMGLSIRTERYRFTRWYATPCLVWFPLFVCLFVCLLACLLVCFFVLNDWRGDLTIFKKENLPWDL